MGDLRNKYYKELRDERHRQFMAKNYPPKPRLLLPTCSCGHTYYDRPVVAIDLGNWPRSQILCCRDCVPEEHRADFLLALKI